MVTLPLPMLLRWSRARVALLGVSALFALAAGGAACDSENAGPGGDTTTDTRVDVPDTTPDSTPDTADTTEPDVEVVEPAVLTLTSVTPAEGTTFGLVEVQLTGTKLNRVVQVLFGDAPALDPFAINDGLLVALTPPHPRGLVDVTVVTDEGERATLAIAYKYADPVQVVSVEPSEGHWLGGEALTIHGVGFTRDAVVLVGGRAALAVELIDAQTLRVVTPEGKPGRVDVHVSTQDGIGRLKNGYTYVGDPLPTSAALRIDAVTPSHGPQNGGTAIAISGQGFKNGAVVRVGAMPATAVQVDGDGKITARTSAGSPGPATVRVIQSGSVAEAKAYTYDGPPAVWAVDPPTGSVAGNTRVLVRGNGFVLGGQYQVWFGAKTAPSVTVLEDGLLEVRTPAGDIGAVAVAVIGEGLEATHPRGFTYFDPAATPGTWGDPIDGTLNVTVQDARSGARLEGAVVILGSSAQTTWRGYTNANGQITFSGLGLVGEQIATASFKGYQVFQLAGLDAENVTLPLERIPTCSDLDGMPCDGIVDPPPIAMVEATILGGDKGPTIPFGECRDWPDAASGMCTPCVVDSDCRGRLAGSPDGVAGAPDASGPAICRELGSEGAFCTFGCRVDGDCPSTFKCMDPTGMDLEKRCVPPPGTPATYCDQTESDLFSDDSIAYPGIRVPASNVLRVNVHLGDFAFFCWSGVEVRGNFRPRYLGVARQLGAYVNGETVKAEVHLDIPLSRRLVMEVDRPSFGESSQDTTLVRLALNLGGDGVLEFPPQRGLLRTSFPVMIPAALTGDLYDATWTLYTEVSAASLNGGSALYEPSMPALDSDFDYVSANGVWAPFRSPPITTRGLTRWQEGDGTETVVSVGEGGRILKRYGGSWAHMGSGTDRELLAIAAAPAPGGKTVNAIALGRGGVALHWDGLRWTPRETGTQATLEAVSFGSETVAYAVAGPNILRWDGTSWVFFQKASANLHAIVGISADEAWAVGEQGLVVHLEGAALSELGSGVGGALNAAVWDAAKGELVAVGSGGVVVRGTLTGGFTVEASGTTNHLNALAWSGGKLTAVGARATIIVRDDAGVWTPQTTGPSRGTLLAVAGTEAESFAMGSHEYVIGPLLGIPERLNPEPGGFLQDRLTWEAKPGLDAHFSVIEFDSQAGPCSACGFLFMIPYTEWRSVLNGDRFEARFPNLQGIAGAVPLASGFRGLTLYRVRSDEGFDFDHTASTGFYGGLWKAWSWRTEAYLH
ncbi:MAG: IPT/TIG domain-containing protein [Deltaproteobacteria bacterium]|nr:IPT/TIG domain-containing protein [Deltaproteobacteria bacterium]